MASGAGIRTNGSGSLAELCHDTSSDLLVLSGFLSEEMIGINEIPGSIARVRRGVMQVHRATVSGWPGYRNFGRLLVYYRR